MANSPLGFVYKETKLPHEGMQAWKKEWDRLTEADKEELLAEASKV